MGYDQIIDKSMQPAELISMISEGSPGFRSYALERDSDRLPVKLSLYRGKWHKALEDIQMVSQVRIHHNEIRIVSSDALVK